MGNATYDMLDSPEFRNSPLAIVFGEGREVRHRIDDPESKRFPFLDDMRAEGVTDYIAMPLLFIDGSVHASSWTTKQPGGFSDEQLAALKVADAAAGPHRRDHQPAPQGFDPARYLCRQSRRRAHSRRPDQARPHRDHACRDLAVGFARLHRAVGPAAGRDRGRYSQSLFRLPGLRDRNPWWRGLEVHGGRSARGVSDRRICRRYQEGLRPGAGCRARLTRQCRCHALRDWRNYRALPVWCCLACRKGSLRQYRRRQPARLHLHRARRQSRRTAGKNRRASASHGGCIGGLRRGQRGRLAGSGRVSDRGIFKGRTGLRISG